MSQVTLYLDAETTKMKAAARSAGVSQSRWVADLIREKRAPRWPESLVKLVGTWADDDFPLARGDSGGERRGSAPLAVLMYALAANTVNHLFKGMGGVAKRFLAVPPVDIALPAVALYEFEVGRLKSRNPERRRRDLEELTRFAAIRPFSHPG